ncbi:MAG: hypothetical protein IKU23_03975 [Clostridia bacterium]|nr:hypothetical protein [Clostridia bacterium]MBR5278405.1 hypothetical protein [Clostridia bacterium]
MSYLVGELVLDSGDRVVIRWPDKTETPAVYKDTIGYSHYFDSEQEEGKEIRLTNHFMRLKGIYVRKNEE